MRNLNITRIIAFKKVFRNTTILRHFLNSIVKPHSRCNFESITLLPNKSEPHICYRKEKSIVALCESKRGFKTIVELQVNDHNSVEKIQIDASRLYSLQSRAALFPPSPYPVIVIAISPHIITGSKKYVSHYKTANLSDRSDRLDNIMYTIIELPKFHLTPSDTPQNAEEMWCHLLKHSREGMPHQMPQRLQSQEIRDAYEILLSTNWTEIELEIYRDDANNKMLDESVFSAAEARGVKEGLRCGLIQGLNKGFTIGVKTQLKKEKERIRRLGLMRGLSSGAYKARLEIAMQLLDYGLSEKEVAEVTELSMDEVEEL